MSASYFPSSMELQFRGVLADIARRLSDDDLKNIRFICKAVKGLTKRDLEIEDALEFFVKLEERGVLSSSDTELLRELLNMVHRTDCLELLRQHESSLMFTDNMPIKTRVQATDLDHKKHADVYRNGHYMYTVMPDCVVIQQETSNAVHKPRGMTQQVTESSYGEDLSDIFEIVVDELGRDWRQIARKLHLTETEIECITEDHMRNLREQGMQCLVLWKRKMRSQATKAALIEALKKCRMLYIADRVQDCQFR